MSDAPQSTTSIQLTEPAALTKWLAALRSRLINLGSIVANCCCGPAGKSGFGILMYHRIAPQPAQHLPLTWNVTPANFAAQISGLLDRGHVAWPLAKVLEHHARGAVIPRNVFVITFDDGYANVFHHALPVLVKYQISATVFVATSFLDSGRPFPFDDWSSAGRTDVPAETWLPLSTSQCHALLDSGLIELAAHTHTHQDFRRRPAEFAADLQQCVEQLQERFGIERPAFAFPYGSPELGFAANDLRDVVKEAQMQCSLTTQNRLVLPHHDPFHWGRFTVTDDDTAAMLAARLNGWNDALRGWLGGMGRLVRAGYGRWGK